MKEICLKEKCTACTACYSICSHGAIEMKTNELGYLYPMVDIEKCVDCNACIKVCPVNNSLSFNTPVLSIAAYSRDAIDRDSSASGGVASVLTQYILKNKGVVYGCVQEDVTDIRHQRIDVLSKAVKLKGSKYVQSDLGNNYHLVRKDLKAGKKVLFVGTPCQIAGLKSYLRRDYDNLFLVDLCCHGVPSMKLLHDNIENIQKKKVIPPLKSLQVSFRQKRKKIWSIFKPYLISHEIKYGLFLHCKDDEIYAIDAPNDYYISGFLSGLFFRENCFTCSYARKERISDLTLADHWGMGRSENPEMKVHKGLSTILINTEKGKALFGYIKEKVVFEERSLIESINGNGQFLHAFNRPKNYKEFQQDYRLLGYEIACKKHLSSYIKKQKFVKIKNKIAKLPFVLVLYHLIKKK